MNSRFATVRGRNTVLRIACQNRPFMNRSAPSCALEKPVAYMARCSNAPMTTNVPAVLHNNTSGSMSNGPTRNPIKLLVAHSLGSSGDVGVRSSVIKSSRL